MTKLPNRLKANAFITYRLAGPFVTRVDGAQGREIGASRSLSCYGGKGHAIVGDSDGACGGIHCDPNIPLSPVDCVLQQFIKHATAIIVGNRALIFNMAGHSVRILFKDTALALNMVVDDGFGFHSQLVSAVPPVTAFTSANKSPNFP